MSEKYYQINICRPGKTEVIKTTPREIKWCFVCRKCVEFTDYLIAEIEPLYYDPWWRRTCPRGHDDGDLFPGRYREYD